MIGNCPSCPYSYYGPLTRDHIIPQKFFRILAGYGVISYKSKDHPNNLQWLCKRCNSEKGIKISPDNDYAIQLKLELYDRVQNKGIYLPSRTIKTIGRMFAPY